MELEAAYCATLSPPRRGAMLSTASIGPDGELVTVWDDKDVMVDDRLITVAEIAVHFAQPLPDGQVLVGRRRARRGQANAAIYNRTGGLVGRYALGDAIEHVFATRDGRIWVGYFDESAYENSGLVRYSPSLEPEWRYPSHDYPIADCYSLNVGDRAVWTSYYSDFPVARITDDDAITLWHTEIGGVTALAAGGSFVALFGGYGNGDHDRVVLARLGDGRIHVIGQYRLILPGGEPIPARARVIGRGAQLHVITEDAWYHYHVNGGV